MLENQIPPTPVLIEDLGMLLPNETSKIKRRYGLYRCSCGVEFKTRIDSIKNGCSLSCGCYKKQIAIKHGMFYHRLYRTWHNMIKRTSVTSDKSFKYYGDRGISVCDRWLDINKFIEDMYPSFKEGLTIDRIDVNGNYEPSNCRWATKEVQQRNTRCLSSSNTSGYRGVSLHSSGKWKVVVGIDKKHKYLGLFKTKEEGAIAYNNYVIDNKLEHTLNNIEGV